MLSRLRPLAVALLLAAVAGGAQAQGYSRSAFQVIARARIAAGGAGWNLLRGWHEIGVENGVRYEAWIDPVRYGMRVETREADGVRVHGFNGVGDWQIAPDGAISGANTKVALGLARTNAFMFGDYYFYPGRFDARGETLGVRSAHGQSYDVVMVKPWGGDARELWFDRRTHLLRRIVDRTHGRTVTAELSDYRRVGPVRVAFRWTFDDGTAEGRRVRQIQSLDFRPADRDLFSLPRPKAIASDGALGGARAAAGR